jgi:O-antigen/teichoic acid export membrane protein
MAKAREAMTSHGLLYFLGRLLAGLLSVTTLSVYTRLLSPREYGSYALVVTVAAIASTLAFQWLNVSVARFFPAHSERPGTLLAAGRRGYLACCVVVGPVAVIAAVAASFQVLNVDAWVVALIGVSTLVLGYYNLALQWANAQGSPLKYAFLLLCRTAGALVLGAAALRHAPTHRLAVSAFLMGHVLALLLANPFRGVVVTRSGDCAQMARRLFSYGAPLMLTFVGTMAVDFADRLMIGWLSGPVAVGPYAAAYDLSSQCIGAVTNILFLAAFPRIMRAYERAGDGEARVQLRSLGVAMLVVALPGTVAFGTLAPELSHLLFGPEFRADAQRVMPVLGASLWLAGFKSYYLDAVFQIRGVTAYQARIAVLMMAVNIALNILWIPRLGAVGAAWATFAAFAAGALASFVTARSIMKVVPLRMDAVKAAACCVAMALAMGAVPSAPAWLAILWKGIAGTVAYGLASVALDVAGIRSKATSWIREGQVDACSR